MAVRTLLLCAALAVVSLWPQGLVLCVSPGEHAGLEHHSTGPCRDGSSDCEDLDRPEARAPARFVTAPAPVVPASGERPLAPGRPHSARVSPERGAPDSPPVSPGLTV